MNKKQRKTATLRVAAAFSVGMREQLTAEQLDDINMRNRGEKDPNVCHSHDYCDANIVMDEAFEACGLDFDSNDDSHIKLWNEAWSIAKVSRFLLRSGPVSFVDEVKGAMETIIVCLERGADDKGRRNALSRAKALLITAEEAIG